MRRSLDHEPSTRSAGLRRWLGWSREAPTVAIDIDGDVVRVLCLRRQAVITACGRVRLPPGTARNGRLRVTGPALSALARLRTELHLPERSRAVMLVQPRSVSVVAGVVTAEVDADEVAARRQVISGAGFATVDLEPVPAALARVGWTVPGPVYAEGGGWRTYRDGEHLEVEPSDRPVDGVVIGPSPVERGQPSGPAPVTVDRGVDLLEFWPLLLGAAMAEGGCRPASSIEEGAPVPVGGWTMERVSGETGDRG